MRSFSRFIKKHLLIFISTILAILTLDVLLFVLIFQGTVYELNSSSPRKVIEETASMFTIQDGTYKLSAEQEKTLHDMGIWGIIIDTEGSAVWNLTLPEEIPHTFTLADVSEFSRGYIESYPVFTKRIDDGLLVLGYPQNSYMKITSNALPYSTLFSIIWYFIGIFTLDIMLLFVAYTVSKRQISRNISPIINSLDKLSKGKPVNVQSKGDLEEIGNRINAASDILISKDAARANWISGVSHDIRTPLSVILGYADRILHSKEATGQIQEQADIICKQSVKIKGLIEDLNLASQLEYDMQPLNKELFSLSKLLRKSVSDFINNGLPEKYTLDFEAETTHEYLINGDKDLIKRAVENLLNNSVNHNPDGCNIHVSLSQEDGKISILVADDGMGVPQEKLNNILHAPHYMNSKKSTRGLQHGMGLHLVKKIVRSHEGKIQITSGTGFCVEMVFTSAAIKI